KHLTGWFGKKKRSRDLIAGVRRELSETRTRADTREQNVRESVARERGASLEASAEVAQPPASLRVGAGLNERIKAETESTYRVLDDKIRDLDTKLPRLKSQVREFFELSTSVKVRGDRSSQDFQGGHHEQRVVTSGPRNSRMLKRYEPQWRRASESAAFRSWRARCRSAVTAWVSCSSPMP